jgi:hypothetical protein
MRPAAGRCAGPVGETGRGPLERCPRVGSGVGRDIGGTSDRKDVMTGRTA